MAWEITFYPFNILEPALGTVDITGDPDAGFPESRLYDRATSIYWKDTVTEAKNFTVDQGATGNLDIDFLAIPGHNFNGINMQWQWSTDNFAGSINDAVTDWTQSGNTQIIKTIASPVTARYWRVTLASMTNPQADEIYMSLGYTFEAKREVTPSGRDVANVQWNRTIGGNERSTKFGNARKFRTYTLRLSAAEYTDYLELIGYLDGYSKPFFFKDHQDNYFMAKFEPEPDIGFDHNTYTLVTVSIIEQI